MVRATINSEKHLVQHSIGSVTAGSVLELELVDAVSSYTGTATEVRTGANVKAVYIEMWLKAQDTVTGSAVVTLEKLPSNLVKAGPASMAALHTYANKKNIFYVTQGLTNDQDADATPFIRQWFKIPKGKQRFGRGDKLTLNISAPAVDITFCGLTIYKEYY